MVTKEQVMNTVMGIMDGVVFDEIDDKMADVLLNTLNENQDLREAFRSLGITDKSFEGGSYYGEYGLIYECYTGDTYILDETIRQLKSLQK